MSETREREREREIRNCRWKKSEVIDSVFDFPIWKFRFISLGEITPPTPTYLAINRAVAAGNVCPSSASRIGSLRFLFLSEGVAVALTVLARRLGEKRKKKLVGNNAQPLGTRM
jgi:hypothetical protein